MSDRTLLIVASVGIILIVVAVASVLLFTKGTITGGVISGKKCTVVTITGVPAHFAELCPNPPCDARVCTG